MATGTMAPAGQREATIEDFAPFFKAFCNGTRAAIVEQLLSGERCVCEITAALDVSQPLISHHLAILRDAGFVRQRSEGTRMYYDVDWVAFLSRLDAFLEHIDRRRAGGRTTTAEDACRALEGAPPPG